ncbi:protein kinase UbiB [Seminavis robusta]|uniref:Protein kinase UbiB n=1 Tax=Seminavis robusta TaxID=568900 RepID=A0A9N8EF42_9STRA|nr:protein kinase UbiB [Seminavis robusta]|eukprot:Sro1031_g233480.1 protein kinase UbiB (737) ;mRNA; f:30217-32427
MRFRRVETPIPIVLLTACILLTLQQQPCHGFSSCSVNLFNRPQNIFVPTQAKKWIPHWLSPFSRQNYTITVSSSDVKVDLLQSSFTFAFPTLRSKLEFPKVEFPSALIQDAHEEYLRRHQIVKKRRVLQRLLEINSILAGQIMRPLLCSLVTTKPDLSTIHIPTDEDWEAFWSHQRAGTRRNLTNAERVAQGVPVLGPTFVKLAQILATRPDILPVPLAEALGSLQDQMPPFDNLVAKRMIRTDMNTVLFSRNSDDMIPHSYMQSKDDVNDFMESLSEKPLAAASVAQVYKGYLDGFGPVAVKVLRPGCQRKVEHDATLFHSVATWVERMSNNTMKLPGAQRLDIGSIRLVQAVDEFTSRVLEDIDFTREVENMKAFAALYDARSGTSPTVKVVVPKVIPELSSNRVIVMEWLEGTRLTEVCTDCDDGPSQQKENLDLIVQAIEMTVSQLIDHGLLHGDPHLGNVLKVRNPKTGKPELGYLDFGLVSYVPQKFRDAIVIAVVQLVFARNIEAVADLCVDLGLLPEETLQDAGERQRFFKAVKGALQEVLIWPKDTEGMSTAVPVIRFENLLPAFSDLIRSFEFTVPPYFLNNIRALATLEGMALKLDPNFNVFRVIYPYSINRLMRNPAVSKRVQETFVEICRSPDTQLISPKRVRMLLNDWALWTGYRKRRIAWDLFICAGGRRVTPVILHNWLLNRVRNAKNLARHSQRVVVRGCNKVVDLLPLVGARQENMIY